MGGEVQGARVDETYMRRCLALASSAADAGETAVGALIVRGDSVIAEGTESTRRLLDPSAHAEVVALRAACQREGTLVLAGCELYTTVEPCVLCAYAIRRTGITRIVYGIAAGEAGGACNGRLLGVVSLQHGVHSRLARQRLQQCTGVL